MKSNFSPEERRRIISEWHFLQAQQAACYARFYNHLISVFGIKSFSDLNNESSDE